MCFVHVRSDDISDYYQLDGDVPGLYEGRLTHWRGQGSWLAGLNGVTAVREHTAPSALQGETSVARMALDAALSALVSRVNNDLKHIAWLKSEGVTVNGATLRLAKCGPKKPSKPGAA